METIKIVLELLEQTVSIVRAAIEHKSGDHAERVSEVWTSNAARLQQAIERDRARRHFDPGA